MMLESGQRLTKQYCVTDGMTAAAMKSGELAVLATPYLAALMEDVACSCVKPYLEKGTTSVGTRIDVRHLAATPVGMNVKVTAELIAVDGRRLTFSITAWDAVEVIGQAQHERFIVDSARFLKKVAAKCEV